MTVLAGPELVVPAPFACNDRQEELAGAWYGPAKEILAAGAVRSGKTQAAARLLVEDALEHPCVYVVARQTYRELKDSTQRAMIHGDGSLPPLIPVEARDRSYGSDGYHGSDEAVRLLNGAEIRFRNLEHAHVWLNTAYGGIMIDQAEEIDQGPAGELLYDTVLTRLSDPRGRRKVLLVANPASEMHWLYRRFVGPNRHPSTGYVQFTLRDNAENLPDDLIASLEALKDTRPHFYRCFILGEWGAFEGAAYQQFNPTLHVVRPMAVSSSWDRVEGMDYGRNHPTAWLAAAVDEDGNLIVFDEYYSPGPVRDHAAEILRRRENGWWATDAHGRQVAAPCFADPSIRNRYGNSDPTGRELSVEVEFGDYGIGFSPGQNDRKAGYGRISELLDPIADRVFPHWHEHAGQPGSPRMFIVDGRCPHLVEQLRNAPVKPEGTDMLEIVDPDWEGEHGHSHAAARYLCLSRPAPSEPVRIPVDDKREMVTRMMDGEDPEDMGWDLSWQEEGERGYV